MPMPLPPELMLRPWLDAVITCSLVSVYFPLSRAWAAGLAAGGSVDRFLDALPLRRRPPALAARLRALARIGDAHAAETARWEQALFGAAEPPSGELADVRRRWSRSATALTLSRRLMTPVRLLNPVPAVKWSVAPPDAVEARHGARLADPARAFVLPEVLPEVAVSRRITDTGFAESWLRFPSPLAGDTVWAYMAEPPGSAPDDVLPTLILLHGIGVEPEFIGNPRSLMLDLARRGVRVVCPEAPSHSRRRPPGWFGGERAIAGGPGSLLDHLQAAVVEAGILTAWAHRRSRTVILGGESLGAITAQLTAGAAMHWPAAFRPDGLFLVVTGGDIGRTLLEGSLSRGVGAPEALTQAGWTAAHLARWAPLMVPEDPPDLDPARIVAVLGRNDLLTFYDEADALLRAWRVPEHNILRYPGGHFTASARVAVGQDPARRLLALALS